jgi:ClpP class serine protease
MSFQEDVNSAIANVKAEHSADLLFYAGQINRAGADKVVRALSQRANKNLILLLNTVGGDSHAAFKIARACQSAYGTISDKSYKVPNDPTWTIYVPNICKSAGTIIALGADAIMMAANAELGPIDIQMRKPEEVGELTSTLTPVQSMQSLQQQMADVFVHIFSTLRFDEQLSFSTKMASDVAKDMASAMIGPIASQIDPMRLAETERLLKISSAYGERLNDGVGNVKDGALPKLLSAYPSHGFVIDRREAATLFSNVSAPSISVSAIADVLDFLYVPASAQEDAYVNMIQPIANKSTDDVKDQKPTGPAEDHGPSMAGDKPSRQEIPNATKAQARKSGARPTTARPEGS